MTLVWALTGGGYFWPEWVLLPLALVVAIHGWVELVEERPQWRRGPIVTRGFLIDAGVLVAFVALRDRCLGGDRTRLHLADVDDARGGADPRHPRRRQLRGARQPARARVGVLEATRSGAVVAQDAELRRIERDLHDGAQARLVALGMSLGLAEQKLATDPEGAQQLVTEARLGIGEALQELRDLARGIHPPVLADRGLGAAVATLADRSALPVDVSVAVDERPPPAVESAAYFVVAEAIANAGKHSGASRIAVGIARRGDRLELIVEDDGRGGADPSGGGLTGLRRRVEALDGTLLRDEPGRRADDGACGAAVRVVIAEDLALLRDGMVRLLEANGFEVVGAVDNGDALVHAVRLEQPDVAIVDIRLPPSFRDEGLRAALELRETAPEVGILVVSQYVERTYATELLAGAGAAGGIGYLLKDRVMDIDDFVEAVRRVGIGRRRARPGGRRAAARPPRRKPGRRPEPARARGGRADGRGPLERGHRRRARPDGQRRREARREHLQQAPPRAVRHGSPPRPRGARLPRAGRRQLSAGLWTSP